MITKEIAQEIKAAQIEHVNRMTSKEDMINYLKKNDIYIDDLPSGYKVLGWTVKFGAFENYLESDEYVGLVESSIYDSEVSVESRKGE